MKYLFSIIILFLISLALFADSLNTHAEISRDAFQTSKEKSLVDSLKNHMTCKSMKVYVDGDLYCKITFRGLDIEIAGANKNGGGTIYINSLGKNQTVTTNCGHCIKVSFADEDLQGVMEATVIIRDNGIITHNYDNKNMWNDCYK
jgi:hypothetical protein